MGFQFPSMITNKKQILKLQSLLSKNQIGVPKGHIAVYVGDAGRTRYVVPLSYLSHPSFQELLDRAEEEFGFNHPTGGLTLPCEEELFILITSRLNSS